MSLSDLCGHTALVTGAGRGIGRAAALGLAEAGADLVLAARSADVLEAMAEEVRRLGRRARVAPADVSDTWAVSALFEGVEAEGPRPDILDNASVEKVRPSVEVDPALWDRILGVNLRGAFLVARRFAELLLREGRPGAIVNTRSLTSAVGVPTAAGARKPAVMPRSVVLSQPDGPRMVRNSPPEPSSPLPPQARRSITFDPGPELPAWTDLTKRNGAGPPPADLVSKRDGRAWSMGCSEVPMPCSHVERGLEGVRPDRRRDRPRGRVRRADRSFRRRTRFPLPPPPSRRARGLRRCRAAPRRRRA